MVFSLDAEQLGELMANLAERGTSMVWTPDVRNASGSNLNYCTCGKQICHYIHLSLLYSPFDHQIFKCFTAEGSLQGSIFWEQRSGKKKKTYFASKMVKDWRMFSSPRAVSALAVQLSAVFSRGIQTRSEAIRAEWCLWTVDQVSKPLLVWVKSRSRSPTSLSWCQVKS